MELTDNQKDELKKGFIEFRNAIDVLNLDNKAISSLLFSYYIQYFDTFRRILLEKKIITKQELDKILSDTNEKQKQKKQRKKKRQKE